MKRRLGTENSCKWITDVLAGIPGCRLLRDGRVAVPMRAGSAVCWRLDHLPGRLLVTYHLQGPPGEPDFWPGLLARFRRTGQSVSADVVEDGVLQLTWLEPPTEPAGVVASIGEGTKALDNELTVIYIEAALAGIQEATCKATPAS